MTLPLLAPHQPSRYTLTRMGVIRLEGAERVHYLNGQVTCDVAALPVGGQSLGAHCDPKGKVWSSFRLLVLPEQLLLVSSRELFAKALPELKKYGVFAKVSISDASEQLPVTGIAGAGSDALIASTLGLGDSGLTASGMAVRVATDRWLLVGTAAELAQLPEAAEADWWGAEIAAGVPTLSTIHQGEYIPQMLNLQALGGISFTKGCYMGQETVARAKYRGANNRALHILQGTAAAQVAVGDELELSLGENWKRSGMVLDCWQQGESLLLSAVLPLDLAPDARLRLKAQPDSSLQLEPLPYSLSE